jgi:tripartite-type tricarboxylate transporter receptor subunit TctC
VACNASRRAAIAAIAASSLWLPRIAGAQAYPHKVIKLILPYTAGSPNDVLARLIAPLLSSQLRQSIVVENRAGGATSIGTKAVRMAEPDGYTLLFSNTPTHVIAPLGNPGFSYDPLNDFAPVALVASSWLILVIAPALPVSSPQEFVAYAKTHPGKLTFGFGQGTLPHLAGELFKLVTQTDIISVPYRGGAQAVTDMLGGRIDMNFGSGSTLLPLIRAGKLRALAVTSPARVPELPLLPTMIEAGLPEMTVVTHYGVLGPAGLAAAVINRLQDGISQMLSSADLRAALTSIGFAPLVGRPEDFATLIMRDLNHWAAIVKATGFQLE